MLSISYLLEGQKTMNPVCGINLIINENWIKLVRWWKLDSTKRRDWRCVIISIEPEFQVNRNYGKRLRWPLSGRFFLSLFKRFWRCLISAVFVKVCRRPCVKTLNDIRLTESVNKFPKFPISYLNTYAWFMSIHSLYIHLLFLVCIVLLTTVK